MGSSLSTNSWPEHRNLSGWLDGYDERFPEIPVGGPRDL